MVPYSSKTKSQDSKIPPHFLEQLTSTLETDQERLASKSVSTAQEIQEGLGLKHLTIGVQTENVDFAKGNNHEAKPKVQTKNASNQTIKEYIKKKETRDVGIQTIQVVDPTKKNQKTKKVETRNAGSQTNKLQESDIPCVIKSGNKKSKKTTKEQTVIVLDKQSANKCCTCNCNQEGEKQEHKRGAKNAKDSSKKQPVGKSTSTTPAIVAPKSNSRPASTVNTPNRAAETQAKQKEEGGHVAKKKGCAGNSVDNRKSPPARLSRDVRWCINNNNGDNHVGVRVDCYNNKSTGGEEKIGQSSCVDVKIEQGIRSSSAGNYNDHRVAKPWSDQTSGQASTSPKQHETIMISRQQLDSQRKDLSSGKRSGPDSRLGANFKFDQSETRNGGSSTHKDDSSTITVVSDQEGSKQSRIIYLTNRAQYERKAELLVNAVPFRMPNS